MNTVTEILDERSRELLAHLIRVHIATGEPVGSRTIAKLTRDGLSSATVRNTIADLEEAGFLESPHTSAGRVPTDKGYRFYVDHVVEQTRLSQIDRDTIKRGMFAEQWANADHLMTRASQLLSHCSESVGIVISPNLSNEVIQHIEFVRISDGRILVITVSRSGLVVDRLIRVADHFSQDELDRTTRYVNANFSGMTLRAVREELIKRMSEEKALYDRLLQNAIILCEQGLSQDVGTLPGVFVDGTSNIISKPDFADTERMRELFRIFEEKSRLVKLLNECVEPSARQSVGVRIGAENGIPSLRGCAVITSSYGYEDQIIGSLGVVGSMRMEYARTISVVNYVARLLEQALTELPQPSDN
jgi:heat-inducible transcriptional repressor